MGIRQQFIATKLFGTRDTINDIGIRVILVPLFGICIPLITKMVPHESFTSWQIKFSYLYTIGIAFIIYEGSRFLLFTLRNYFDWFQKPLQKVLAILIAIPSYVVPVSVLLLTGWYQLFMQGVVDRDVMRLSVIIILVAVFFLVNLYETFFLIRDVADDRVRQEQLERARAEAQLEALKNQVDPHFIFNSLNTLSHLIDTSQQKARLFNTNLADVYRYILHNKARDLVFVKEEMEFVRDYFSLLQIRFEKAVQLELSIPEEWMEQYLLPPISLQILLENAVKHNEFSDDYPLIISIQGENETLRVSNEVRKKMLRKPSSRIGLENLKERFRLVAGHEITITEADNRFTIIVPLLKING